MELAALGLRVDGRGAIRTLNQYSASASNAGRATEKFERTTKNLTATLATLGGFFGVRQLVQYADTWTLISARIGIVTKSTEEMMTVQNRLFSIAQRTRNTLAATSVLYTRTALNADQLGRSHEELLIATESVNAALLISGSTGVEAAQSMRQLAQALGSGRLQGDEFRTVMEAMPVVARGIADEMGVAVGKLKDLSKEGLIDVQTVLDALIRNNEEWVSQIEDMPFTVGQSIEIMTNAFTRMIGIINRASGITATLGKALFIIADNADKVVAGISALLIVMATYRTALLTISGIQFLMSASLFSIARVLAAATAGFVAYKVLLDDIAEATKEWERANALLTDPLGERTDKISDDVLHDIEDMIRLANQAVVLAGNAEESQKVLEVRFEAVNRAIEARRKLKDEELALTLEAIRRAEELGLIEVEIAKAVEAQAEALKEQQRVIDRFLRNLQRSFADVFATIFDEGVNKFEELFSAVKRLFTRLLAEMAAAKVLQGLGPSFESGLRGVFGVSNRDTAISAAAQQAGVLSGQSTAAAFGQEGVTPVQIEGVTASVEKSLASKIAQFVAPALAGFFVGRIIGGETTNRALGALGGAASGALTGAAIGGPAGAVVGGLAGAIGGFFGAGSAIDRLAEKLENLQMVLATNNLKLQAMRDAFEGVANRNLQARALAVNLRDAGSQREIREQFNALPTSERAFLLETAQNLGIQILNEKDKLIRASLTQLIDAIDLTIRSLTQFSNNLSDARQKQDAFNKLFDVESTPKQNLQDTFDILSQLAPELLAQLGLSNLNLDSTIGRDVFLNGLRDIFNMIVAGDFANDPALLGAFADKDQLIDAILRAKDALDEFNKTVFNVTTDFPRAMDIPFFEQLFGTFGTGRTSTRTRNPNTMAVTPSGPSITIGTVTIANESDDSGEDILRKIEAAALTRRTRGGSVDFARTEEAGF